MKEKKGLPSLTDSDIVTNDEQNRKADWGRSRRKISTIAIALTLTTASATMLSGCEIFASCDSDTTQVGDAAADSYDDGSFDTGTYADSYDYGQYDTSDSDATQTADPCS